MDQAEGLGCTRQIVLAQEPRPGASLRHDSFGHGPGGIRETVARTVASMPDHGAYVARYCGVPAAQAA